MVFGFVGDVEEERGRFLVLRLDGVAGCFSIRGNGLWAVG